MGERLLRLYTEAADRLAKGERRPSKKTVDQWAKRFNWTRVSPSAGIVCVPESQVDATVEELIARAEAGGSVSIQREISKLGVEARQRKRLERQQFATGGGDDDRAA